MTDGPAQRETGRIKRRPTQADVARRAGVSQAMVSLVINDAPGASISKQTQQRIRDAMEELGYQPNRTARSLRTRKTYTIASVIPDITNPFYPAFERGVQDAAQQRQYDVVIYNTDGLVARERQVFDSILQNRADGVVAVLFHLTARDLRPVLEDGITVVRFEPQPKQSGPLPLDNVFVDNRRAAHQAVRYLIAQGHSAIGIIIGHAGPRTARLLGYRDALREAGLIAPEPYVQVGNFQQSGGYAATRHLLQATPRPTAIFAENDEMALGALSALRESHIRVPEEMAIIGFDDIPAARLVTPSLTTVSLFPRDVGRRAAEMLFERLEGSVSGDGRSEELPFELVRRESA
ncbi:MAG TPA: LacI family DNA-binding transcriptional regulator [Thermomicrobiales bacterium]|nr:LacI family DNA-binding transcriptional regulator [Thermomicrobiales bacterium]